MTLRTIFLTVFLCCYVFISPGLAETVTEDRIYNVEDISWKTEQNSWIYLINGNRQPTYTRYELYAPHRLRLDIAGGAITEHLDLPMEPEEGPVSMIRGEIIRDKKVPIYRLELILNKDADYVVRSERNNIIVKLSLPGKEEVSGNDGSAKNNKKYISNINFQRKENERLLIEINTGKPIYSCEATEIPGDEISHPQLMVDLESVGTGEIVKQGLENSLVSRITAEPYEEGSRVWIEASSDMLFEYNLLTNENGLHIEVLPPDETKNLLAAITGGDRTKKRVSLRTPREITPRQKKGKNRKKEAAAYVGDQFSTAGYTGEKVTVDFYQSNLHNVFRLIGEVSGRNIIVAEGVSGTLTLSLRDVPWDFMLDIILNLKNLNKEEQYNTIIISPASKKFEWPGKDEKEDLVINRPEVVSRDVVEEKGEMEAAKLLRRAKSADAAGNFREALNYYEQFFNLNPDRGDIAGRITSLALTELGLKTKAAHYGEIACRLKPEDGYAALLTATALAELGKPKEAVKYFELATTCPNPSAQALMAYAAFSEEYRSYRMALESWRKYEQLYGASLETMVNRARISDLLGRKEKAAEIYRGIKMSGYEIPSDLAEYINHRLKN